MTKKLVIIDDSSTQLNILKTLFTNNGWEVCGVQSAKIGYEVIFDFAPDLIVTDAIMPLMGGFQLIKLIRENEKISKIPVIVYSILNEANAKFYIKEELSEYFLRKDDNHNELLKLAQNIIEKFPLNQEYKDEILKVGLHDFRAQSPFEEKKLEIEPEKIEEEIKEEKPEKEIKEFNFDVFSEEIRAMSDFSFGDEKIMPQLFSILYNALNYDLCALSVHSFSLNETKTFFDIRNIILSPILKNSILAKNTSKISVMYKKYAPNLMTIVNESEFLSKIDFEFSYKEKNIAKISLYAREKSKWSNEEEINQIKEVLYNFSKTRYIKRTSQIANNKEGIALKYILPNKKYESIKNKENTYFGIIQISNFSDLNLSFTQSDLDILNSKISEKIIECLDKEEQIYKNDEDEYSVVISAKDEKHAKYRFEYILKELEEITKEIFQIEFFIVAAKCNIHNNFNITEAQKNTREILESGIQQDKVVIYSAE